MAHIAQITGGTFTRFTLHSRGFTLICPHSRKFTRIHAHSCAFTLHSAHSRYIHAHSRAFTLHSRYIHPAFTVASRWRAAPGHFSTRAWRQQAHACRQRSLGKARPLGAPRHDVQQRGQQARSHRAEPERAHALERRPQPAARRVPAARALTPSRRRAPTPPVPAATGTRRG